MSESIMPQLAAELANRYGKGYSRTSLYQYVKFYRMFPEIVHSVSGQSQILLSWTHYRELLRVEDTDARAWYEREAAEQMWSVRTEWSDSYIDLVFYNFMLKCFVLVDLKVGKIIHQDVGQMDMYVRMYDDLKRGEGDGPTLGIVLCSETDEDIARYSVLKGCEQLFATKYRLCLPTDEQLRAEIEEQKRIFQAQQEDRMALPKGGE